MFCACPHHDLHNFYYNFVNLRLREFYPVKHSKMINASRAALVSTETARHLMYVDHRNRCMGEALVRAMIASKRGSENNTREHGSTKPTRAGKICELPLEVLQIIFKKAWRHAHGCRYLPCMSIMQTCEGFNDFKAFHDERLTWWLPSYYTFPRAFDVSIFSTDARSMYKELQEPNCISEQKHAFFIKTPCMLRSHKWQPSGESVMQFVIRAMFPYHFPRKFWKTNAEWIKEYGDKKIWAPNRRRLFSTMPKTTSFGPRRTLDGDDLARKLDRACALNLFENWSCWVLDLFSVNLLRVRNWRRKDEMYKFVMYEPSNCTAAQAHEALLNCLGEHNMEKCVIVRPGTNDPNANGCQIIFIGRNINKHAVQNNCLLQAFGRADAVDGRITALHKLPTAFALPASV